jgi:hypothetical protein
LAARDRLPLLAAVRSFADEGGLLAYGVDIPELFRQAAGYVDRILRGEKPADLPVQQPTEFDLVVNLRAARTLGLTVPDKLLALADDPWSISRSALMQVLRSPIGPSQPSDLLPERSVSRGEADIATGERVGS